MAYVKIGVGVPNNRAPRLNFKKTWSRPPPYYSAHQSRPTGLYDPSNLKHLADRYTWIRMLEKDLPRIFGLNFILAVPTEPTGN